MRYMLMLGILANAEPQSGVDTKPTLFTQVSSALSARESELVCGLEPEVSDLDAWYSFGDCSGYYGPIDSVD